MASGKVAMVFLCPLVVNGVIPEGLGFKKSKTWDPLLTLMNNFYNLHIYYTQILNVDLGIKGFRDPGIWVLRQIKNLWI
jgi:hypothetical protein